MDGFLAYQRTPDTVLLNHVVIQKKKKKKNYIHIRAVFLIS